MKLDENLHFRGRSCIQFLLKDDLGRKVTIYHTHDVTETVEMSFQSKDKTL